MYYILTSEPPIGQEMISLEKIDVYTESWLTGDRFEEGELPPNPLRLRIDPDMPGDVFLDFYKVPVPLMTRRLVEVLEKAGVDNLDLYPTIIINEETGESIDEYIAVNIIGTVSAADAQKSITDPRVPEKKISAAFDKLVLDESATHGQLLFRLAEAVSAILVHQKVKETLETEAFPSLKFLEPDDWFSL